MRSALCTFALFISLTSTLFHLSRMPEPPESLTDRMLWSHGVVKSITLRENGRMNVWLENPRLYASTGIIHVPSARLSVLASQAEDLKVGAGASLQSYLFVPQNTETFDAVSYARFFGPTLRGYAQGMVERSDILAGSVPENTPAWTKMYWRTRDAFYRAVQSRTSGDGGALLTALLTGHRDAIFYHIKDDFRKSGLAHLLAISGLHLALVTGLAYFGLRRVLGFHPHITDTYNTQKWAAVPALILCISYMLMAGASLPTVRASIVLGLLLVSVLFSINVNPIKLLCMAAWVVVLLWPYSVVGPSFQMSFIAAFALMLFARIGYRENAMWMLSWWYMPFGYLKGVFIGSVIASFATMPFVAWHFGSISLLGVGANLIAVPMTGLIILPFALSAVLLMPLGLDAPFWFVSQWGAEKLVGFARAVANLPFGVYDVSHRDMVYILSALGLCLLGGMLIKIRKKKREA